MLDFTFLDEHNLSPYAESHYARILELALRALDIKAEMVGVSLRILNSDEMRQLNFEYRNKDKATDILSFPIHDDLVDRKNEIHDILELGDLALCVSVAQEKAEESGRSLENEISFLIVHGLLHLIGYDHERSKDEEIIMFRIQDDILAMI